MCVWLWCWCIEWLGYWIVGVVGGGIGKWVGVIGSVGGLDW